MGPSVVWKPPRAGSGIHIFSLKDRLFSQVFYTDDTGRESSNHAWDWCYFNLKHFPHPKSEQQNEISAVIGMHWRLVLGDLLEYQLMQAVIVMLACVVEPLYYG